MTAIISEIIETKKKTSKRFRRKNRNSANLKFISSNDTNNNFIDSKPQETNENKDELATYQSVIYGNDQLKLSKKTTKTQDNGDISFLDALMIELRDESEEKQSEISEKLINTFRLFVLDEEYDSETLEDD
eukprot:215964_1